MAQRRNPGPPPVVAFLPLSTDVDFPALWRLVLQAFAAPDADKAAPVKVKGAAEAMDVEAGTPAGAQQMLRFPLLCG